MKINVGIMLFSAILLTVPVHLFSQTKGLLEESIDQVKSEDGNSWINTELRKYAYDGAGRKTVEETYNWDSGLNSWKLTHKHVHQYNTLSLTVYENYMSYDSVNGNLTSEYIHINRYQGSLLIHRKIENISYVTSTDNIYNEEFAYDKEGRVILYKTNSTNNGRLSQQSQDMYSYDKNGCTSTIISTGSEGDHQNQRYQKTEITNDTDCHELESLTTDYHGFVLDHLKWDREFDDRGNEIHTKLYRTKNLYPSNWIWIYETWNNYDGEGLLSSSVTVYPNSLERILFKYDNNGRNAGQEQQTYDSLSGAWITRYTSDAEYDDFGRTVFFQYHTFAPPMDSLNAEIFSQRFFYDEKGFQYKSVFHFEGFQYRQLHGTDSWNWVFTDYTFTNNYQDRCDGNPVVNNKYYEDIGTEPESRISRELYSYYDLASCEDVPDKPVPIVFFPNPAKDYFNIYNNKPLGTSLVTIYNKDGYTVFSRQLDLDNYAPVDVSGLPSGLYIVKLNYDTGVKTGKLLISQ